MSSSKVIAFTNQGTVQQHEFHGPGDRIVLPVPVSFDGKPLFQNGGYAYSPIETISIPGGALYNNPSLIDEAFAYMQKAHLGSTDIQKMIDKLGPADYTFNTTGVQPPVWNPSVTSAIQKDLYTAAYSQPQVRGYATDKTYTDDEIIAAMEAAVAYRGADYRDRTAKHTTEMTNSDRCIQGEMLVDLGIAKRGEKYEDIPGAAAGMVHALGRPADEKLYAALAKAQSLNDREVAWGEILKQFKADMGLAA